MRLARGHRALPRGQRARAAASVTNDRFLAAPAAANVQSEPAVQLHSPCSLSAGSR